MTALLDRRLLFVSGKGGVGKTTVAAALGLLASERGKRTLVCEIESKGDLSSAYECGPTGFAPKSVAPGLFAMSMDTEASLREYLRVHLRVPVVGRLGPVARAFDFVATAAPGVREILTVGKLCYEVRENHYDLVIADASSTGHLVGELAAPIGINDLVKVGMVQSQTRWILDMLDDPSQTGVCLVTTPEELPVNEAIDLAGRLERDTGVRLAAAIANRVLPELFARGEAEVFRALESLAGDAEVAHSLGVTSAGALREVLDAAQLAVKMRRTGTEHLERFREAIDAALPLCYLPLMFVRDQGPRVVRLVADALGEELGE